MHLIFLFLFAAPAWASDGSHLLTRAWQLGTDPRQRSVLALLQSRDGYLWIGTGAGLIRFDGVSFTHFTAANTQGIASDHISFGTLWEDLNGAIWVGTESHGVLRNDHGHFQTLTTEPGPVHPPVLRIDGDETGAVWVYTTDGVSVWRNGKLQLAHPEQYGPDLTRLIPISYNRTIDFPKTGLWRHGGSGLERFSYGHWRLFPVPPGEVKPFEEDVASIFEDAQRRVWYSVHSQPEHHFCVDAHGLHQFDGIPARAFVSFQDSEGFLWITDHQAHTIRWKDGHSYPFAQFHTPFLTHVLEANDGTVWAGTIGTDLFQFQKRRFNLTATAGSPEVAPTLFRQRSSKVWAGGINLLHRVLPANSPIAVPHRAAIRRDGWVYVDALSETPGGDMLVGSRALRSIEQLHGTTYEPYLPPNALAGTVQAMLLASSGEQWVGTSEGLYRIRNPVHEQPIRLLSGSVLCLTEAPAGTLWVGTGDGPYRFSQEKGQELLIADRPWRFGAVLSMRLSADGQLWMATEEHGLVLYDGKSFQALGTSDGLPTDAAYSVEIDGRGDLWIGSDVGLIRIRKDSIARHLADPANRLQVSLLNDADGLPASTVEAYGNQASLMLPDGMLWLATELGIVQFDPATLFQEPSHPHILIEEHAIDGSALRPGPVVLNPGQSNLELHYTALGSNKPEQLLFRYRLEGYDTHWIYAKERRTAYYSHLPPGAYTFAVQTAATDGAGWEALAATMPVRVRTPFYRTGWMAACVMLVCTLSVGYQLLRRQRRVLREQQMRQAFTHQLITTQETERKRIAHDLHDSVGQQLVLIRRLATLPQKDYETGLNSMNAIADQATMAIREVETISYDLRPYQLDRLGLTKAILSSVESFKQSSPNTLVQCEVEDIDNFLPRDKSINLYRIVQEALSNILKHASATRVRLSVIRLPQSLRLSIADDGRGFQTASGGSTPGRLGLVGIRERAEALGGRAQIESSQGFGTTVIVDLPDIE